MKSKNPQLATIFMIVFVDVLGFTIILPLLPLYSKSFGATPLVVGAFVSVYVLCQLSDRIGWRPFGPQQVGYLRAYSGLINLSMQILFLGKLVKKFGEEKLLRFAFVSSIIGLYLIGLSSELFIFVGGFTLNSLGNALLRPNILGLIPTFVRPSQKANV